MATATEHTDKKADKKADAKAEAEAETKPRETIPVKQDDAALADLTPGQNRYRIELRHPDMDGTEITVIAADEDAARAIAGAAPDGATIERCVLMEVGPTEDTAKAQAENAAKLEKQQAAVEEGARAAATARAAQVEAAKAPPAKVETPKATPRNDETRDEHGNRATQEHKPRRG